MCRFWFEFCSSKFETLHIHIPKSIYLLILIEVLNLVSINSVLTNIIRGPNIFRKNTLYIYKLILN